MNMYQGLMDMFTVSEKAFSEETFFYELKSEGLDRLLEKYPIKEIAGEGTDYERCYRVMVWLYGILIHKPDYHNSAKDNAIYLLDRLYRGEAINCRAAACILVECYLALGIKSQAMWLLSANPYDDDCHVVPIAYCKELGKWVIFDSTVNTTIADGNDRILSIFEVRNLLAKGADLHYSETLRYIRGDVPMNVQKNMFSKYLEKNMFMMKTYRYNRFGYEGFKSQEEVYLVAAEYDIDRYLELKAKYWEVKKRDLAR
ncbi:hypothetical protein SAMN02910339_02921 [Lachnospiraceae bacterium YSD2013]|nr:hypothetical protein [Lachnospiraceae bacterium]SCX20965.1 hypothetical protein SAMN02910339_02921 [Lachnospiraceae bacterium YSD2013]